MMKYRGPKDHRRVIQRKYMVRLAIGLVVILVGVISTAYTLLAGQSTIMVPDPIDPLRGDVPMKVPINKNPTVGIIALPVGSVANLRAIFKFRRECIEIKEKEPGSETTFIIIGLSVTLLALLLGGYAVLLLIA